MFSIKQGMLTVVFALAVGLATVAGGSFPAKQNIPLVPTPTKTPKPTFTPISAPSFTPTSTPLLPTDPPTPTIPPTIYWILEGSCISLEDTTYDYPSTVFGPCLWLYDDGSPGEEGYPNVHFYCPQPSSPNIRSTDPLDYGLGFVRVCDE